MFEDEPIEYSGECVRCGCGFLEHGYGENGDLCVECDDADAYADINDPDMEMPE